MDVLRELARHGVRAELVDGRLKLSPKHRITRELLDLVKEHKKEIAETLRKPYIDSRGILVIPSECDEKYRWWTSKGQSIRRTLVELGAPPEVVVKYVEEGAA